MKADYKNWVPKGLIVAVVCGAVLSLALGVFIGIYDNGLNEVLKDVMFIILIVIAIVLLILSIWLINLYRAFSYDGNRQMSRQIIEGIAEHINLSEGELGLDVGCGSGALTIACAKRNPEGKMIGIDRWGKDYSSFSQLLCERNAEAENVGNVEFKKDNALKLDFSDETFDAVTSNYVYHNISGVDKRDLLMETLRTLKKGGTFAIHDIMSERRYGNMKEFVEKLREMGYEEVDLIDTSHGKFMSRREAKWLRLTDSTILFGKK